jgi:uncharacterized protein (DUF885 family)
LDSQHAIDTAADADAYLSRLSAFGRALDEETLKAVSDASSGGPPPSFILDRARAQLTAMIATPAAQTGLVQSLARRTKACGIDGGWGERAEAIYTTDVAPALHRQAAALQSLRAAAPAEAGVWRLTDGEAYYAACLREATTTAQTPDEVHAQGLDWVATLTAELDEGLARQGFSKGGVGQRLRALYEDPQHRFANTEEGRAALLASLNVNVAAVEARLPAWFATPPKGAIEIRRIPPSTEATAAGGYYQPGSLDGARAGAYYINLRDTAEVPRWTLPTLTYHEAVPGHHLQLSLQQAARLPLIRKMLWFAAYGEGWALYAEQLADEMELYADDPLGRIGYLHDALFRAVRLVLDTGLHAKRWSREAAIAYFIDAIGDPESCAVSEVERYCVWPGQACSYMVGKLTWLDLRTRARASMGPRFDIRAFHDAGLLAGAVPLTVLDRLIADYEAGPQGGADGV